MTAAESVEVMHDYAYDTSEGKHITINKGDVFTLLAKSTSEWWKVIKGDTEKFYVPANYVRLVIGSKNSPLDSKALGAVSNSISIHSDIPTGSINGHQRNFSNASSCSCDSSESPSYDGSVESKGDSLDRVPSIGHAPPAQHYDSSYVNSSMLSLDLRPTITISAVSITLSF